MHPEMTHLQLFVNFWDRYLLIFLIMLLGGLFFTMPTGAKDSPRRQAPHAD
jgi:hypothetical protein